MTGEAESRADTKQTDLDELRRLIRQGGVQRGYRWIVSYMMGLRTYFEKKLGEKAVSGLYQGYMDMTYFALFPEKLRKRKLKIAILFHYDVFRFEVWLAGRNRQIQRQYWEKLRQHRWPQGYRVSTPGPGVDSILEYHLTAEIDVADPASLTRTFEAGTMAFVGEIESALAKVCAPTRARFHSS